MKVQNKVFSRVTLWPSNYLLEWTGCKTRMRQEEGFAQQGCLPASPLAPKEWASVPYSTSFQVCQVCPHCSVILPHLGDFGRLPYSLFPSPLAWNKQTPFFNIWGQVDLSNSSLVLSALISNQLIGNFSSVSSTSAVSSAGVNCQISVISMELCHFPPSQSSPITWLQLCCCQSVTHTQGPTPLSLTLKLPRFLLPKEFCFQMFLSYRKTTFPPLTLRHFPTKMTKLPGFCHASRTRYSVMFEKHRT